MEGTQQNIETKEWEQTVTEFCALALERYGAEELIMNLCRAGIITPRTILQFMIEHEYPTRLEELGTKNKACISLAIEYNVSEKTVYNSLLKNRRFKIRGLKHPRREYSRG